MTVDVYSAPFHVYAGTQQAYLVLCDHASNAVPESYGQLGLLARELEQHIAWDQGARGVSLALAEALDCPAVLGGASRLMVDLNRDIDDGTLIVVENDNIFVPGNLSIGEDERVARVKRFHTPYHAHIDAWLDELLARQVRPVLISVHSFNPNFCGIDRPWQVGVLWKQSREPVVPLIDWFAAQGFEVGDNQPYDARVLHGHTLDHHALRRNLPHVLLEIRNDQIRTDEQQAQWGARLHRAITETGFGKAR